MELERPARTREDVIREFRTTEILGAARRVTNDLLDYSKITKDRIELEDIPFDLAGLVDSTVRLLTVRAFERGIELSYDVADEVPQIVRGDPSRLRQILTNLIGNAVNFSTSELLGSE